MSSGLCLSSALQRLLRLVELALLQVDEPERAVRLGDVGLELERALERLDRTRVVALLRVRLAHEHVQLGRVAVLGEQPPEHGLGLRRAAAAHECQRVGVLQRRVAVAPGVAREQLGRARGLVGLERGERQHPAQVLVAGRRLERARERRRRLARLLRVEPGDAERVLELREAGVERRRLLELGGRLREAPAPAPAARRG